MARVFARPRRVLLAAALPRPVGLAPGRSAAVAPGPARVYTTDEATGEVAAPAQTLRKYLDLLPLPPTLLRKVVTHRPLHDIPSAWEVRSADRLPRFVDVVRARDEHPWLAQQVVDPAGQRHLEEVLRAFVEARAPDTRFQDHSLGGPIDVRVPSTRHEFDEARVEMPARFATARSAYPVLTNLPCGTLSDEDRIVWDQRSGVAVRGYRRQPGDDTWCVEALRSGYAVRDIGIVLRELVPGIQRTYPEKRRVACTSIPSQLPSPPWSSSSGRRRTRGSASAAATTHESYRDTLINKYVMLSYFIVWFYRVLFAMRSERRRGQSCAS